MNLFPKKSLGQNFLTSLGALQKIIETADIKEGDTALEVGPGKGVLTHKLLEKAGKVIAVEKDDRLIEFLQANFEKEIADSKLTLINKDILEFDPKEAGLEKEKYSIVANIPYYITGQFLRKFLSDTNHPSKMVLLVQKEVAERIIARDGKESLLSMSVRAYGEPKFIETVKRGSFFPMPNVDSAIILIENIKPFHLEIGFPSTQSGAEEKFFKLIHAGFAQKRKMILGNLTELFGGRNKAEKALIASNIDPKSRAENLKIDDWKRLVNML